jgi:hypothetical protein
LGWSNAFTFKPTTSTKYRTIAMRVSRLKGYHVLAMHPRSWLRFAPRDADSAYQAERQQL